MRLLPPSAWACVALAWAWAGSPAWARRGRAVGVGAPDCSLNGTTLACDYRDSGKEVYLDEGLGPSVERVAVSNALRLRVSERACVNLSLYNVTLLSDSAEEEEGLLKKKEEEEEEEEEEESLLKEEEEGPCEVEVWARDSTLDRLPRGAARVRVEGGGVALLATSAAVSRIDVVSATVGAVAVSRPLREGASATFRSAEVGALRELGLGRGSEVLFWRSRVGSEGGVVVGPGATLRLEDCSGSLTVKGASDDDDASGGEPARGPFQLPCDCGRRTAYFRVFVAMLVLFVCLAVVTAFAGLSLGRRRPRPRGGLPRAAEGGALLPRREAGRDRLLALEELRRRVGASLRAQKWLHRAAIDEIEATGPEDRERAFRENEESLVRMAALGRHSLLRWRKIVGGPDARAAQGPPAASLRLLSLLERLLDARQNDLEREFERRFEDHERAHLGDLKATKVEEEDGRRERKKEEEELRDTETRVRDVEVNLDSKVGSSGGVDARLRHLDSVLKLQREHLKAMEEFIAIVMKAQKLYVRAFSGSFRGSNEEGVEEEKKSEDSRGEEEGEEEEEEAEEEE